MRWNKTTFLWIAAVLILAPIGFTRMRAALQSTEEGVEIQIERLLKSLEDREPRRVAKILSLDYVDVETGYGRRDVVDASKIVLQPGARYRAKLAQDGGLEFLATSDEPVRSATVRVRCMLEIGATSGNYRPWWNLEATLDLERRGGSWKVVRSREVNHDRRPFR
ncbi:MAG: hypothetical protein AAGB93_18170 [Planctomycetota bacterium]